MAFIKLSDTLYMCQSDDDRDLAWAEGAVAIVQDADEIAKYYKLVEGEWQFLYNQSEAPSLQSITDQLNSVLPSLADNNGKYLKVVDGVVVWATVSSGSGGYDGDPETIVQNSTHR